MAEGLIIPEDSVDPDAGDKTNENDKGTSIWWYAALGIAITLLVAIAVYVYMSKSKALD